MRHSMRNDAGLVELTPRQGGRYRLPAAPQQQLPRMNHEGPRRGARRRSSRDQALSTAVDVDLPVTGIRIELPLDEIMRTADSSTSTVPNLARCAHGLRVSKGSAKAQGGGMLRAGPRDFSRFCSPLLGRGRGAAGDVSPESAGAFRPVTRRAKGLIHM